MTVKFIYNDKIFMSKVYSYMYNRNVYNHPVVINLLSNICFICFPITNYMQKRYMTDYIQCRHVDTIDNHYT